MSATIKDVAQLAGVSVATVSRVLNEKGPIREATRSQVLEAVAQLRYVPHSGARSLITNQTQTIGVLLPDIYGEFFSEVIRGIDLAARRAGYHLVVSGSHSSRTEIEAVLRALRGRVDGLIIMSPDTDAGSLEANLPPTLPIVLLNSRFGGRQYDSLGIDNYGGATAVVHHLLELGHRRIAHIRGPERNLDAQDRLRGYRDALAAAGIAADPALEVPGDFTEEAGFRAAPALLGRESPPTAIFAANDSMAIGCLSALQRTGIRVPDDISLAGFDDIPIARFMSPPLTSVSVSTIELGARAAERLLYALERKNQHERRQETLPTALAVRGSCAAAQAAGVHVQETL
jgi:LacI family transcriptional regulator